MSGSVYARTRRRNPATGEVLMAGNTWELSPAPAAELVAMVLRTQLGGCALDPGLGVDWATLRKVATGAPALARDAITTGLQRLVRAGIIADLAVSVRVDTGDRMLYEIVYRDTRSAGRTRVTGAV